MRRILLSITLIMCGTLIAQPAFSYDFSYSYKNPYSDEADDYIVSTSNAELYTEANYRLWKPIVGATTKFGTTPGIITYHFEFSEPVSEAHLSMRTDTFHWSYSKGHTYIHGSTDGVSWIPLAEAEPPENGGWNPGNYSGLLPDDPFSGTEDIWLKVELYSFGSSAASGGAMTNTAQHSRYDANQDNTTFALDVNYVPEPATMTLMGMGILGLLLRRRKI